MKEIFCSPVFSFASAIWLTGSRDFAVTFDVLWSAWDPVVTFINSVSFVYGFDGWLLLSCDNPLPLSPHLKSLLHLDLFDHGILVLQDVSDPWTLRLLKDDPRFLNQNVQC